MDNRTLGKLQNEQLDILLAFDAFCNRYGISYFLEGGTALGAMRHKGFIPWDDDIDVGMLRDDYNKLIAFSEQLPSNLILRTPHNTPQFPGMFAKLCRRNTLFLTQETSDAGFQQEIFIDIFVYDELAKNSVRRKKQLDNAFFWQSASYLFSSPHVTTMPQGIKGVVARAGAQLSHSLLKITMDHKSIVKRFEKSIGDFEDGSGLYVTLSYPKINPLPRDCFFPARYEFFEGHSLPVPSQVERYLENLYGNWTLIPNPEERHVHSPLKIQFSDGETWTNS